MATMAVIYLVLGVGVLALAVITGVGSHRRGSGRSLTALSAVFFPLAWVAWYVHDSHPHPGDARSE